MVSLYVIGGISRTVKSKISQRIKILHVSLEILNTDSLRKGGNDNQAWDRLEKRLREANFPAGVLIEGVAITPQRIYELNIPTLALQKAVFLGYSRESHADSILNHAQQARHKDWVFNQIQKNPSYVNDVRSWMKAGILESAQLKIDAEARGYGYFDITDYPDFEKYATDVADYLLTSSMGSPEDSSCKK